MILGHFNKTGKKKELLKLERLKDY